MSPKKMKHSRGKSLHIVLMNWIDCRGAVQGHWARKRVRFPDANALQHALGSASLQLSGMRGEVAESRGPAYDFTQRMWPTPWHYTMKARNFAPSNLQNRLGNVIQLIWSLGRGAWSFRNLLVKQVCGNILKCTRGAVARDLTTRYAFISSW